MAEMVSLASACQMLGVSTNTIRNYTRKGLISDVRSIGGHRRFLVKDLEKIQGKNIDLDKPRNRVCCYCRVSSNDQKQHWDLDRQKLRVLEYCAKQGYKVEEVLAEVCSGMKAIRPKLNKLYKMVENKEIDYVVIEHKDRLTRFMFDVFQRFFSSHNVGIIIVEEDLPKSFETELVTDIMSIMTSFTATVHSRRKRQSKEFRKKIEQNGVIA